ncbi:UNVERIFIED_CONTAM: hypothetical protein K2H54_027797 [Gekko kuhli]
MSTPSRSSPPPPPLREGSVVSAAGLPKPCKPDKPPKPSKPSSTPSDRSKSKPAKGPKRPSESKSTSPTPKRPKHLGSASTPTSTPTRAPRPRSESSAPPSDDRSQPLMTPEDHQAQVVTVPSRSPSIYSRPPSEILDREDSPTDTCRDRRDWLTDVESGRRPRYSRSRSRSYRDDYLPLSHGHRYRRYSPDSRSPSPYTYARCYFASRDRPDSRLMSPYPRSREPDRRDRRSPSRREELPPRPLQPPSAALGAPPSDPAPRHVDPPLYMPDLSKPTESSADSDDHGSGASDSDPDASVPTHDADTEQPGSLSPSDGSKAYVLLIERMCKALQVQLTSEAPKLNDYMHKLVQADLPTGALLPMLPVHLGTLKEAWDTPASIPRAPRRFDALYKIQPGEAKFLVSHPAANSLIVHSASKAKQSKHPTPPDKEGRKLDTLGRKFYSITTMAKLHNYLAHFLAYAHHLMDLLKPLLEQLPDSAKNSAIPLVDELSLLDDMKAKIEDLP